MDAQVDRERFSPTGGRYTGVVAIVMAGAVVVLWFLERDLGQPDWTVPAAILAAAVCWATLLRPGVTRVGDTLSLRNSFDTVQVPMVAIDDVDVRQVLSVHVGEQTYESAAISLTLRQLHQDRRRARKGATAADSEEVYARYVEDRLRQGARKAQLEASPGDPDPVVVRRPAWGEIGVCVAAALATVLLVVL